MRVVPANFTGAAGRICHLIRVSLKDGRIFRWTDHDVDIVRDGESFFAAPGMRIGAIEKTSTLSPDSASLDAVLNAASMTEEDLAAGAWDGAIVEIMLADWEEAVAPLHLFTGVLGEVTRLPHHFNAEVRGLESALDRAFGRVYARVCDASVGDGRCGVNLESPAYKGVGVIADVVSARMLRVSGLSAFASDWFTEGRLIVGARTIAIEAHRKEGALAHFTLKDTASGLKSGDSITAYAGCMRTAEMCRAKFANMINFRGFPHMPGNDVLQGQASNDGRFDGGSRFR